MSDSLATSPLDAIELDDVTIDAATDGVSAGAGILASMLSWIRGAVDRSQGLLAGVRASTAGVVDPKSVIYPEKFDPTLLMSALQAYGTANKRMLHGGGLLLRLGQKMPPSAFQAADGLTNFGGVLDSASFNVRDYDDADAAVRALESQSLLGSGQLAWLVNAAMARAAVTMAPFVYGTPRLEFSEDDFSSHALVFEHGATVGRVGIDKDSNPLSLHRHVRKAIQEMWRHRLAEKAAEVREEFVEAFKAQRLPAKLTDSIEGQLDSYFMTSPALGRLKGSSAAFISIKKVADTCMGYIDAADRVAVRNALRHNGMGLNWRNYTLHLDPSYQRLIAAAEPQGALAYAEYSAPLLNALASANMRPSSVFDVSPGRQLPAGYDGAFTLNFVRALRDHIGPRVRAELEGLSPRYLCVAMCGHPNAPSLERHFLDGKYRSNAQDGLAPNEVATRAGIRLARALDVVASSTPDCKPVLPWTRVVSSREAAQLLMCDAPEQRAVDGLTNLVRLANTYRSKGARSAETIYRLPQPEDLMDAPAGNAVGSMLHLGGVQEARGQGAGDRAALALVRDILDDIPAVVTQVGDGKAYRWDTLLARPRANHPDEAADAGGFRVGIRTGTKRHGAWAVMTVSAFSGKDFKPYQLDRVTDEDHVISIRGQGTPEGVAPLVLEVAIPNGHAFRQVHATLPKRATWDCLEMVDIGKAGLPRAYMSPELAQDFATMGMDKRIRHAQDVMAHWTHHLTESLARNPVRAAAAFPAAARFLWSGGKLSDTMVLRPIGMALAFKYARACLGSGNAQGMGLVCRQALRPAAMSSSDVSLVDIALDSTSHTVAQSALEGLRCNPRLEAGELAGLVQASVGKLIERHPELLQLALDCGAVADSQFTAAWAGLHPARKSPEIEALANAALMQQVIAASVQGAIESPTQRPTRRMRNI